jgi:cellobiose-specific phosphotransferase system component IIC
VKSQRSFYIPRSSFKAIMPLVIAGSLTVVSAIVTGKNNQTGIGLIEIYDEQ